MSETDGAVVYHPERVTNQLEFSTEISFLGMATISHLSPLFFCRGVRNFRDFFYFSYPKQILIYFISEEKGAGILFLKYRRLHSYSPIHLYVVSFLFREIRLRRFNHVCFAYHENGIKMCLVFTVVLRCMSLVAFYYKSLHLGKLKNRFQS